MRPWKRLEPIAEYDQPCIRALRSRRRYSSCIPVSVMNFSIPLFCFFRTELRANAVNMFLTAHVSRGDCVHNTVVQAHAEDVNMFYDRAHAALSRLGQRRWRPNASFRRWAIQIPRCRLSTCYSSNRVYNSIYVGVRVRRGYKNLSRLVFLKSVR